MSSIVPEHSEYLFDHLISLKLDEITLISEHARCVAINLFTDKIYVLVADHNSGLGNVLIYSKSGEFLRSFLSENKESVNGMAIHKNNVYIVSGLSCFLHFKVAESISLIGSKNDGGSGSGKFKEPRQLDISNEGYLFVADFGNNRVQILDGSFQYKRHISHHSMLKPRDVKLTSDEVYVLGDIPKQSTYCIHMFTHMGEKLRSAVLNGIPYSMLSRGFGVDTCGNVIMIDNATLQIKFFTKEGNLLERMDALVGKTRYKHLIGIAWMNKHKLLILSSDLCDSLEIYSHNLDF